MRINQSCICRTEYYFSVIYYKFILKLFHDNYTWTSFQELKLCVAMWAVSVSVNSLTYAAHMSKWMHIWKYAWSFRYNERYSELVNFVQLLMSLFSLKYRIVYEYIYIFSFNVYHYRIKFSFECLIYHCFQTWYMQI